MEGEKLKKFDNHIDGDGEKATVVSKCLLKKLEPGFMIGDIVWVKIHGTSWWPAMIVDGNKSTSDHLCESLEGEVCVRLYGSYDHMRVNPMKCQAEFENVLKKFDGNITEILNRSLERDLLRVKSSSGNKRKASSSKESSRAKASKLTKQKEDKIQSNQEKESTRRVKVMQDLGLIAPCGSPFKRNSFCEVAQ